MKVALVHESLSTLGGAERVLKEMTRVFPEAPVYALEASPSLPTFSSHHVQTSFLQRLPRFLREHRLALPLYPTAPETFDLSQFDVVLTSSSAFAKGIITRPGSLHVCYCHAPTRFLWDWYHEVLSEVPAGSIRRAALIAVLHGLRLWDQAAARRVDLFLANSETTRARIAKYYGRDAIVLYPPVQVENEAGGARPRAVEISAETRGFLFVGRLSPYKGAALAIETFKKLELPLLVVGAGRAERRLRRLAGRTVKFRGFVPDGELPALYAQARAVIFPSDDDFGLVPVEAMAAGTPVLALRRGGATETIIEGITGEFFDEPLEELLADCVRRFLERAGRYDQDTLRAQAARFSPDRFRANLRTILERAWEDRQRRTHTARRPVPLPAAS